jgi:hypothetical protein
MSLLARDRRQFAIPANAGIHSASCSKAAKWVPAFPTDQVRGLKAYGIAIGISGRGNDRA